MMPVMVATTVVVRYSRQARIPTLPLTVVSSEARALITLAIIRGKMSILSMRKNMSPGKPINWTRSSEGFVSELFLITSPIRVPRKTAPMVETSRTFLIMERLNSCPKVRFFLYKFSLSMELCDDDWDFFLSLMVSLGCCCCCSCCLAVVILSCCEAGATAAPGPPMAPPLPPPPPKSMLL